MLFNLSTDNRTSIAMKIIISGASGLIGSALTDALRGEEHSVLHLVRADRPRSAGEIRWDPASAQVDIPALEGADAVVHLSGASISETRWTQKRKDILRSSRIDSTRVLVNSLAQLRQKPRVFICASAVGYYGSRADEILTEASEPGRDFLSGLARDWETEAKRAAQAGIRTVILRSGVILSNRGGALPQMIRPFKLGVGGRLGSGRQWLSWIALEDVVGIVRSAITNPDLHGPMNIVAPEPVRNADFAQIVGHILHRPSLFPAPEFVLRLALGEMADGLLLASQRAIPEQVLKANYVFQFRNLDLALKALLRSR
jgi:uncharacterized protein